MKRVLLLALCVSAAWGAIGPEHTAVVVNGDSWASLTVANAYLRLRGIPPGNAIVLQEVPPGERITLAEFRHLLGRIEDELADRGLAGQIHCLAYAPDLPVAVDFADDPAPQPQHFFAGKTASTTGLTVLARLLDRGPAAFSRLDTSTYYDGCQQHPESDERAILYDPQYAQMRTPMRDKQWAKAESLATALSTRLPRSHSAHYLRARCLAQLNRPAEAIAALEQAVDLGLTGAVEVQKDVLLAPLVRLPAFRALIQRLSRIPDEDLTIPDSLAFPGDADDAPGPRQRLAMFLAITGGRGEAVDAAVGRLERSVAADGSRPDGAVWFMASADKDRTGPRRWAFAACAAALRTHGVNGFVRDDTLPPAGARVVGAVVGTQYFDWEAGGATFLPGAWADHLTSFGGEVWPRSHQTPLTAWLKAGAAGASGTVTEPWAFQEKFPTPFLHLHRVRGLTMVEALWRSVAGPYQLLAVGDPLSAPWRNPPRLRSQGAQVDGAWIGQVDADPSLARVELHADGRRIWSGPPGALRVPLDGLPGGGFDLRVVAIAADAQQATARATHRPVLPGPQAVLVLPASATWGEAVEISASCQGSATLHLMHLGRELARAQGAQARWRLHSGRLGLDRPALWLEARDADGRTIARSQTGEIVVRPSALLPAHEAPELDEGAILHQADGSGGRVTQDTDRDWIGPTGGHLDGWIEIAEDGLHQVQWFGDRLTFLAIDEREIAVQGVNTAPLFLARGAHRLRVGVAPGPGPIELRFGRHGSAALTPRTWRGELR